jgi:pimeloyl-ACP methyl ester carboxylesterase
MTPPVLSTHLNQSFDVRRTTRKKEIIIFEHAGHRPLFEEPAAFDSLMTRILEETYTSNHQRLGCSSARSLDPR